MASNDPKKQKEEEDQEIEDDDDEDEDIEVLTIDHRNPRPHIEVEPVVPYVEHWGPMLDKIYKKQAGNLLSELGSSPTQAPLDTITSIPNQASVFNDYVHRDDNVFDDPEDEMERHEPLFRTPNQEANFEKKMKDIDFEAQMWLGGWDSKLPKLISRAQSAESEEFFVMDCFSMFAQGFSFGVALSSFFLFLRLPGKLARIGRPEVRRPPRVAHASQFENQKIPLLPNVWYSPPGPRVRRFFVKTLKSIKPALALGIAIGVFSSARCDDNCTTTPNPKSWTAIPIPVQWNSLLKKHFSQTK